MGKIGKKVHKYYEYFLTKIKLMKDQKHFVSDDVVLKYMLKKKDSDCLAIVFSSCTRKGLKARYNYVRTLQNVDCNQLFILDDFAEDHRGGYYIGSDMRFNEEQATKALISKMIQDCNAKKVIFCGSSKGGWASLNFGLQYPNAYIVCGGPQYHLGDYLVASENMLTLKHITGDCSDENKEVLNHYLEQHIRMNQYADTQTVFIHYSNCEHTYEEHIKDLLDEIKRTPVKITEDVMDYANHSDISLYFPEFLVKSIKAIENM
ncbi:MAG: hypothetical protein ACI4F8_11245 [Lachnospiraceae bacterium]